MKEREQFNFYEDLSREEKASLTVKSYGKNQILDTLNKKTMKYFYFILEGKLKLGKNMDNKIVFFSFRPPKNHLVGLLNFYGNMNLDLDLISDSDTLKVIKIPVSVIKRLKKESLEFSDYIHENIMKLTINSFEILYTHIFYGIRGLIASKLIKNSKSKFNYLENYGEFIDELNVSRDGFYKGLNSLIKEDIVEKEGNSIKILNEQKLKDLYFDFLG